MICCFLEHKFFLKEVMDKFKSTFKISREEECPFRYLGLEISQESDCLKISQSAYLKSLSPVLLSDEIMKNKDHIVSAEEKSIFKRGIGKLGWITSMTRPDVAYHYCVLSTVQANPVISDFVKYKKVIRQLLNVSSCIRIRQLELDSLSICVYSDAAFANLPGGASQLGYVVFLRDKYGNSVPISWTSKKSSRVARSTLTAETLAAVEAVDCAIMLKTGVEETLSRQLPPIVLITDSKSLIDTSSTSNTLADKRLQIDMSALRQMIDRGEITLKWTSSESQLADVLTKEGVSSHRLTEVLVDGRMLK